MHYSHSIHTRRSAPQLVAVWDSPANRSVQSAKYFFTRASQIRAYQSIKVFQICNQEFMDGNVAANILHVFSSYTFLLFGGF